MCVYLLFVYQINFLKKSAEVKSWRHHSNSLVKRAFIITFAFSVKRGISKCKRMKSLIKSVVYNLLLVITRFLISFIKVPALLKISILKKLCFLSYVTIYLPSNFCRLYVYFFVIVPKENNFSRVEKAARGKSRAVFFKVFQ